VCPAAARKQKWRGRPMHAEAHNAIAAPWTTVRNARIRGLSAHSSA
jgi:hypothetical protein